MNIEEIEKNKVSNPYYKANPEMFDELMKQVFKSLSTYGQRLNGKKCIALKQWIVSQLPFISNENYDASEYSITEYVYLIFSGMTDFPKCQICGKTMDDPSHFLGIIYGFKKGCSKKCSELARQKSYVQTCIREYGVPHYASNKERYEERCDKLEEKYGVRNVFQLESTKKQIKQTCKEQYGDENYVNVKKTKQTKQERYGNENFNNRPKAKQTFIDHYGVEHNMKSSKGLKAYEDSIEKKYGKGIRNVSQAESVKRKKTETFQKHYGVDHPMQREDVKQHFKEVSVEKYGVPYPMQNPDVYRKAKSKYYYDSKWFDSAPEIAFYIWLTDNNIAFEYKPSPGLTYEFNGKIHHFFPDFKVNDIYYEIKGNQFINASGNLIDPYDNTKNGIAQAKQKCMEENGVIMLTYNEYIKYVKYVKEKYGTNFLKQFRQRQAHVKSK